MRRLLLCTAVAVAMAPASEALAVRLLVYNENAAQDLAQAAAVSIAPLGPSGTTVATAANFNTQLTTNGPWDCVVVDCPSSIPTGGWTSLINYVNGGGRCVMSFWDWDNSAGAGAAGLPQAFGASGTTSKLLLIDGVTSFTTTAAGTTADIYASVTMPNNDWASAWLDDGDNFSLMAGTQNLGNIGGSAAVIRRANKRAIACFVLDEAGPTWVASATNFWRNLIRATGIVDCACSGQYFVGDRVKSTAAITIGGTPIPIGTQGTVICGFNATNILVSWDGVTTGHAGNGNCNCPDEQLPAGSTSGWFVPCTSIRPIVECAKDINFDGTPGTAAPPSTLGPYNMTAFPANTPCPPASVTTVAAPAVVGGSVGFSQPMEHFSVTGGPASTCTTWTTWSHGYTGDVYFTGSTIGSGSVTMTMPPGTGAFYFYLEPNLFGTFSFTATSNGGTTSGSVAIAGSSGARYFGFYSVGGSLQTITISNPAGDASGWAIGEFGIAKVGQTIFVGTPGTAAPPPTLGPYVMNPFPLFPCNPPTALSGVPSPLGGTVGFTPSLDHRRVGAAVGSCLGWGTWSHGYTGDLYTTVLTAAGTTATLTMPPDTGAFYLYVEPNSFGMFNFTVTTDNGTTSGSVPVEGSSGARYFGFYALGGSVIQTITVTNPGGTANGFAVGEFGIGQAACGLTCLGDLNGDGIINGLDIAILLGQWTGAGTYAPCPPRRPADMNGDCRVNGLDLAIMLGAWGPC